MSAVQSIRAAPREPAPHGGATDRAMDAVLAGLDWRASVFHVGQYCGRWRASTEAQAKASFHLVLHGQCWLHRPGLASIRLSAGSGVFLLRDAPHFLSPYENPALACGPLPMSPFAGGAGVIGSTGLACGFFSYEGPMQAVVASWMPDVLLLEADDPSMAGSEALFGLMRREAVDCAVEGSPLLDRLASLLFFYVLRAAARESGAIGGSLALLSDPILSPLVLDLMDAPAHPWSVQDMARRVHLSRAALFRQFALVGAQSPLLFLQHLRMQLATQRLARGEPIAQVCEAVGYESPSAFTKAFKRITGVRPGAWQREGRTTKEGAIAGPHALSA